MKAWQPMNALVFAFLFYMGFEHFLRFVSCDISIHGRKTDDGHVAVWFMYDLVQSVVNLAWLWTLSCQGITIICLEHCAQNFGMLPLTACGVVSLRYE